MGREGTGKLRIPGEQVKFHLQVVLLSFYMEGGHLSPLRGQPVHINIPVNCLVLKAAGLRQKRSVLRNQIVAAEYQIRGGFSFPGGGVQIAADKTGRLSRHQISPIRILSCDFIPRRQVHNHGSSRHGMFHAGRSRHPEILADLRRHHKPGHLEAGKQNPRAKGNLLPSQFHHPHPAVCRGKLPGLIVFRIVGQIHLRNQTQNFSPVQGRRHIVQLAFHLQREPHKNQRVHPGGLPGNPQQLPLRAFQKQILPEQIPAGISGNAQLRKSHDPGPMPLHFFHQPQNFIRVVHTVGHLDFRRAGRSLDKSMSHSISPSSLQPSA